MFIHVKTRLAQTFQRREGGDASCYSLIRDNAFGAVRARHAGFIIAVALEIHGRYSKLPLPRKPTAISQRRGPGPTLEGAVKRAELGVAQKKRNFRKRVHGIFEVVECRQTTRVIYQFLEIHSVLFQLPLQRARAHCHFFRNPRKTRGSVSI